MLLSSCTLSLIPRLPNTPNPRITMQLYPAIDLKEGQCVRLYKGDMAQATVYSDSPADQAAHFEALGFSYLHVVDLDGAFQGKPANEHAIKAILTRVTMPVQLGGGLRNMDTIGKWLDAGISRVILGTVAQKNPLFVKEACRLFPGQIVVGIDARGGMVATNGWANATSQKAIDLALKFEDSGVAAIIYTDINRDGAMEGPNLEETVALAERLMIPVIVSGGISSLDDLKNIKALHDKNLEGAIIGRALYNGSLDAGAAIELCGE